MKLPSWHVYCRNTTEVNALCFHLGQGFTVWYSYSTPVAFRTTWGGTPIVRQNDWGPTTGKHLNAIDDGDKANRLPSAKFEEALRTALDQV